MSVVNALKENSYIEKLYFMLFCILNFSKWLKYKILK